MTLSPCWGSKDPQAFHQMAAVWKNLAHPNIVPLLGVTADPVQLVSGWMPETDLTGYTADHPDVDRLSLVGVPSTVPARRAYAFPSYLMSRRASITSTPAMSFTGISGEYAIALDRLTTGMLTPADQPNILVDITGHAMITDCGLAIVTQNLDSIRSAPDEHGHSTRWIAPEILDNRGTFSKEADVFSFAMVVIEVRCFFKLISGELDSSEQRSSLAPFRLTTNHLARLCWRLSAVSVRHGRSIRLSRTRYGR